MIRSLLILSVFFVTLCISSKAHAVAPQVQSYALGSAQVWAIADSTGDRDMDVFKNLDPDLLKRYAPDGKSPSAVMAFAVRSGSHTFLIDTGLGLPSGARASLLMPGLKAAGITPEEIDSVLLTHLHGDHIGGLVSEGKRAFPNARIYISRPEHGFWLSPESLPKYPDRKANFEAVQRLAELYKGFIELFDFETTVIPNVQALDARGHTPGHTAFLLDADGEKLLFWGDLIHSAALQFPHPEISARYDMNPSEAAKIREVFMLKASEEKLPIAGSHLPFPAIGRVQKNSSGGYIYVPGL